MVEESRDERVYPVRNNATIDRMQADYRSKIQKNIAAGRQAFSSGDYKPFKGFPRERWGNIFGVSFELDSSSQQTVVDRVSGPMQQLARQFGIPAIFAGIDDLPPHISLHAGVLKDVSDKEGQAIDAWLLSNKSHLALLSKILVGLTFRMDTLVVGPTSYICVSKFGDEQGAPFRTRMAFEKMMERSFRNVQKSTGLPPAGSFAPPYRYDDIFHMSISRLTGATSSDRLLPYLEKAYDTIGKQITQEPIPITVASIVKGRWSEWVDKHLPQLLVP